MPRWKLVFGLAVAACLIAAFAGAPARADDKPAVSGVWAQSGGEMRIEFADKDVLKVSPHGKDELILFVCKYSVGKDGRIKAKITGHEGSEKASAKEILPEGFEFSFKFTVKGDAATLEDVKGKDADALKGHLEGKYEKKK
jgi:hypothetical protein